MRLNVFLSFATLFVQYIRLPLESASIVCVIVDSQIQKYGYSHNESHRSEQEIK